MSFTFASSTPSVVDPTVEISSDGAALSIWPTGKTGPLIVTTAEEWRVLSNAVELVLSMGRSDEARVLSIQTYVAQEGHNGDGE